MEWTRRNFLADVGRGVLIATLGPRVSAELGLGDLALGEEEALDFGPREPLVCFLQETPPEKLLPLVVERLRRGTSLRELVAATALANARTFGGEDYVGYHALMALMPALQMAAELPEKQQALPVLKVVYRNVEQIQKHGGRKGEALRRVTPPADTASRPGGGALRDSVRRKDLAEAERTLLVLARGKAGDALDPLLAALEDKSEVHRVVLTFRSWDLVQVVGAADAHTLLRQAVRYYVQQESAPPRPGTPQIDAVRTLVPKLLDEHKLHDAVPGGRRADDAWVERMSRTVVESASGEAARAVAAAIAEGIALDSIREAVALAANALVLRDSSPQAHGATSGVHASDTVHAFGSLAGAANPRNAIVCTILSAWHVCSERGDPPHEKFLGEAHPQARALSAVKASDPQDLRRELEAAVRGNDQSRACAIAARYGELQHAEQPVLDLLLRFAVSEDGKLHAEKYYRTVREELARARPAFRWRHVVGLARFLASAYGQTAPGYAESCALLG